MAKVNISNILSLDYFGALIATMIFPFFLLPFIGTFKSSLVFGLVNMSIGFVNLIAFREELNVTKRKYRDLMFLEGTTVQVSIKNDLDSVEPNKVNTGYNTNATATDTTSKPPVTTDIHSVTTQERQKPPCHSDRFAHSIQTQTHLTDIQHTTTLL